MRTASFLQDYLDRTKDAQAKVEAELEKAREDVRVLEKQSNIIYGQVMTLEQLLDYEAAPNTPASVDFPVAGDKIEEMHENRLEGPDGMDEDELFEKRQEVYLGEAMNNAEAIDAENRSESSGENPASNT